MKIPLKLSIFFFFLLINLVSNGGHVDSFDGALHLATTENIINNQIPKIPPNSIIYEKTGLDPQRMYTGDKIHMSGGLLLQSTAIPTFLISEALKIESVNFVPFFTNSIVISLTSLMIFLVSREIYHSIKISFILALVFNVCSFVWAYVTSFFQQPIVGLALVSFLFFFLYYERTKSNFNLFISGIFLGLTFVSHPGYIPLALASLCYPIFKLRKNIKQLFHFFSGFIITGIVMGMLNFIRFDSFFDFGYSSSIINAHNDIIGILGLIASPGHSIILFYPLFILFPFSLYLMYKNHSKSIPFLCIIGFTSTWLFFGTLNDPVWASYGNWGPRYLVPILPLITIPLGSFLIKYNRNIFGKSIFVLLAIIGFIVSLLGTLVWYMYAYAYGWEVEELWKIPGYGIFIWDPYYSPIIESAKVLSSDFLLNMLPVPETYQIIGLAPCEYDIILFCKFGLLPLIIIGGIIIVLAYLIIKKINQDSDLIIKKNN